MGDDLFGSREDAYSETVRQKRWDWYQDDFSARLKPGAKRILMNTRWHEEDIAGRVLQQIERKEIKGRVISIPAIAEEDDPLGRKSGEYLWDDPGGYNYAAFLRARQRETSPMMWAALYQQRPAPEEGDYFKAAWLKPYDKLPLRETLRVYGGSDYAVTADGGDYTVHLVVGLDPEGRMYLLDRWRKQTASDEWVEAFCDLVTQWKPMGWAEEKGQISAGVGPAIDRRQRERKAYVYRQQFPTKSTRPFALSPSEGAWLSKGSTFRQTRTGTRAFARSCSGSPLASTTIRLMPSASSGNCSTRWSRVRGSKNLRSRSPTPVIDRLAWQSVRLIGWSFRTRRPVSWTLRQLFREL